MSICDMRVGNGWDTVLADAFAAPSYNRLARFLDTRYDEGTVYPPKEQIFTALRLTPPESARVVIVGQDPYINARQAQGMAFSVPPDMPPPPSLQNIYTEMRNDLGGAPATPCLFPWALQGVLLLNAVLSVEAGKSGSHHNKGWEEFTDSALGWLGMRERPLAFVLWGAPAQKKEALILNDAHLVLKAPHPSPLSAYRGFFGSRPFSKINAFLEKHGETPIAWF
ncbi:MAG: uracil-DNA glycosylase [Oscillospiraceae bacterium]|jgi:uracil-DNA glycosylase|nr:uracil-DNA glycosylase [Oscillospiraceae bacterium]